MTRHPVESSQIRSLGYDAEARVLEVEFTSKGNPVYRYFDVSSDVYAALSEAESVGAYFTNYIKRGGYRYERVVPEDPYGPQR